MALTSGRWLTAALLGCAAIGVWQLPTRDPWKDRVVADSTLAFRPAWTEGRRLGWPDADARLKWANLRLRILEIRDSAFAHRVLPDTGLTIGIDPRFPGALGSAIREQLETQWRAYRPGTKLPVEVAVVWDTSTVNGGLPMARGRSFAAFTFMPDSGNRACRAVVRLQLNAGWLRMMQRSPRGYRTGMDLLVPAGEEYLWPCALVATFGRPGRGMGGWLNANRWEAAKVVLGNDAQLGSPWWNRDLSDEPYGLLSEFRPESFPWLWRVAAPYALSKCLVGQTRWCERSSERLMRVAAGPRDGWWEEHVITNELTERSVWENDFPIGAAALGPASVLLVADMVRTMPRRNFEALWTSDRPFPEAFASAAGEPLGEWVERWAERIYGPDVAGPWLRATAWLRGMLVIAAMLAIAMLVSRERRLT